MKIGLILGLVLLIGLIVLLVFGAEGIAVVLLLCAIFLKFTVVDEGTAKPIMRMGGFKKCVMSWSGYEIDSKGDVVESKGLTSFISKYFKIFGGLRFVGIRFIDNVYKYTFRWRDLHIDEEGKDKIVSHKKENMSYILVKEATYCLKELVNVETKPDERIPVNAFFLVTMKVVNPFKTLFRAPPNWCEKLTARLFARLKVWIGTREFDDLISAKSAPEEIWEDLHGDPLIVMFKKEWGVEIVKNGIDLRNVEMGKKYQDALAKQKQMELEAEGDAEETVGMIVRSMAIVQGRTKEEIQREIKKDPKLVREYLDKSTNFALRKMAIKAGLYREVRVGDAEIGSSGSPIGSPSSGNSYLAQMEKMIIRIITATQGATGKPKEKPEKEEKKGEKKKRSEMSDREKIDAALGRE